MTEVRSGTDRVLAADPGPEAPTATGTAPRRSRWRFWSPPSDQPRWSRPALLVVAGAAAVAYAWRLGSSTEIFYAAADRSMSTSWHDFFFAAFDPAATISLDKLPGAFWVQALSVRLLGAHTWSVALPQAVEGVLSVMVLFRTVRRCAGPGAALVAAGLLAFYPATVTLDRSNVADTLLVLLLVLAADAVVSAITTGRHRSLLMAGLWVGLAFQAKMLEAWLVLPALVLAFLVAGRAVASRRVAWGGALVAVALAVSLSWTTVVSLTPRADRPYVDGTHDDSVASQVFDYNGVGRVDDAGPNQVLGRTLGIGFLAAPAPPASAVRLLGGAPGRDVGWLLLPAAGSIPILLWARRRRHRTDPVRAAVIVWGGWLAVLVVVFSVGAINSYYLGALSPPIAALVAVAASQAWASRRFRSVQVAVACILAATVGYAVGLLPGSGTGLPGWLTSACLALGLLALASVAAFGRTERRSAALTAAWCACAAMVAAPLVASVSVVTNDLGAFDTPFQPTALTAFNRDFFGAPLRPISTLPAIESVRRGSPDLLATQTSVLAAPFIFATGQEVLPFGGYDGSTPAPTLPALRAAVAAGQFHLALTAIRTDDVRARWIQAHCLPVHPTGEQPAVAVRAWYCLRSDARR